MKSFACLCCVDSCDSVRNEGASGLSDNADAGRVAVDEVVEKSLGVDLRKIWFTIMLPKLEYTDL